MAANIWEPAINKINSLAAAAEAATVILSIDETVRNPRSAAPGEADGSGVGLGKGKGGRGRGMVSQAMGGGGMAGMIGAGRGGKGAVRRLK